MRIWAKQNSFVFMIGLTALVVAFAYGMIAGGLFVDQPVITALRGIGLAFMLGGLPLWAMEERYEAGKPGINPLFGALVAIGCLAVVVALIIPTSSLATALIWTGIGLNGAATLLALIVVVVNPAFTEPVTVSWPEGGEPEPVEHHHHEEAEAETLAPDEEAMMEVSSDAEVEPQAVAVEKEPEPIEPDDLTAVEGIGPKVNSLLQEAGVETFTMLSERSPEEITTILKDGGFRAPFDATTWPKQANLAAHEKWDELETLQKNLKGGRE